MHLLGGLGWVGRVLGFGEPVLRVHGRSGDGSVEWRGWWASVGGSSINSSSATTATNINDEYFSGQQQEYCCYRTFSLTEVND